MPRYSTSVRTSVTTKRMCRNACQRRNFEIYCLARFLLHIARATSHPRFPALTFMRPVGASTNAFPRFRRHQRRGRRRRRSAPAGRGSGARAGVPAAVLRVERHGLVLRRLEPTRPAPGGAPMHAPPPLTPFSTRGLFPRLLAVSEGDAPGNPRIYEQLRLALLGKPTGRSLWCRRRGSRRRRHARPAAPRRKG